MLRVAEDFETDALIAQIRMQESVWHAESHGGGPPHPPIDSGPANMGSPD